MDPNSETRGIYLARKKNGEVNSGFDAKLVKKATLKGDL